MSVHLPFGDTAGSERPVAGAPPGNAASPQRTTVVILDYCGGARTDALYCAVADANPTYQVCVLDNASPVARSQYVSHSNVANTYIGGGIRDCIRLAEEQSSEYLLFIANDITFRSAINIAHGEALLRRMHMVVQLGCAITRESSQAGAYPWMVRRPERGALRAVPHCDLLCCFLRLSFIRSFGGFPPSKGGWGYDWELAFQARERKRKIVVMDECVIHHSGYSWCSDLALGATFDKYAEMAALYSERYGHLERIRPPRFGTRVHDGRSRA